MNPLILVKIISILLVILSGFMAVPAGIALFCGEVLSAHAFAGTMAATIAVCRRRAHYPP